MPSTLENKRKTGDSPTSGYLKSPLLYQLSYILESLI